MTTAKRNGDKLMPVLLRLLKHPTAYHELGGGLMLTTHRGKLPNQVWLAAGRHNIFPSDIEMRVLRFTLMKVGAEIIGDEDAREGDGWHIKRLCVKVNTK